MHETLKWLAIASIAGMLVTPTTSAMADSFAIPKNGKPCPSGYSTSGNYCVPSRGNQGQAIEKNGPCPSGFNSSSSFCVTTNPQAVAIHKSGPCPTGYSASANYCVKR